MLPSASDLTYFLEVAQTRSLTQAARRLGLAQPSLSLAMQRLEHELGSPLFLRTRGGMSLTKAGEQLLADTRRLLDSWEHIRARSVRSMSEVRGRFTLGCHVSVARYALPRFAPALLRDHPELDLQLHHDLSRRVTQKVLALELDLGLVINPEPHPDLVMRTVGRDQVTLWRAKRGAVNEDVLICEPSLLQTQALLKKLRRQFTRVIESSSLEVIAALTASGAGIGVLPARVAGAALASAKDAPKVEDEIVLIYRMENKGVRAIQELSRRIQEGFA